MMDATQSLYQQIMLNGQNYLQKRCPMVLGIGLGNYHYEQEALERRFRMAANNSDKVVIFMAHKICEHNYRALGYKNPEEYAEEQGSRLKKQCEESLKKIGCPIEKFNYVKWMEEVQSCPAYLEALQSIDNVYQQNSEFRCEIQEATKRMLTNIKKRDESQGRTEPKSSLTQGNDIEEGVKYIRKELAFFEALPKIYMNFEEFVFVYHRKWPDFLEKYFNGYYDGIIKPSLGFVVFE